MDEYITAWWVLFAAALFMLLPLDLLTTLVVVWEYGVIVEANPIMRRLLDQGLFAVTVANLLAAVLVVVMFQTVIGQFRQASSSDRRLLVPVVTTWVVLLNLAGVVVVANNLSVWL